MADNTPENLKSVEERDREWLDTVYRGDKEKDLTPRAVMAGMVFGGLMSLSNLYVGTQVRLGAGRGHRGGDRHFCRVQGAARHRAGEDRNSA